MKPGQAAIRVHAAALLLLLGGCVTYPSGPRVTAFPGTGMSFEQFRSDDFNCREFALRAIGGDPAQDSARQGAIDSAVAGTAVGAAAGALIGSASGNPGAGAAIGAGSGLVLGSLAGTDAYRTSGSTTQGRYDTAYVQCMYGRGHQVPVPASVAAANQARPATVYTVPAPGTPAPQSAATYPPPNTPPPPGY